MWQASAVLRRIITQTKFTLTRLAGALRASRGAEPRGSACKNEDRYLRPIVAKSEHMPLNWDAEAFGYMHKLLAPICLIIWHSKYGEKWLFLAFSAHAAILRPVSFYKLRMVLRHNKRCFLGCLLRRRDNTRASFRKASFHVAGSGMAKRRSRN